MSSTLQLTEVIVGIGNPVHAHVRRHNEINADSTTLDALISEQMNGGMTPSTLNEFSILSGGLSTTPQGNIEISDGWNIRRGLAMLRFVVSTNAINQEELVILGYLVGGEVSFEGLDPNTVFVPVRSWSILMTNRQDLNTGLPYTQTTINDSQQFLLGTDKNLVTNRPIDVLNNMGVMCANVDMGMPLTSYTGMSSQDLKSSGILMSKTKNLDPTHCSRAILGSTIRAMAGSMESGNDRDVFIGDLFEKATGYDVVEQNTLQNAFLSVMNASLGGMNFHGFNGYTFGEIAGVFENLADVLNLNILAQSFEDPNWLMTTSEYGSSSYSERIATEVAVMAAHALVRSGLTFVEFLASNNATEIGGLNSENGLMYHMGAAMPLLNNETNLAGRVETFKEELARSFFARYRSDIRGGFSISINAKCYVFGETSVTVVIDGKPETERTFTNATYKLNLTSTNISENHKAINSTINMLNNIQSYLGFN
ncbi:hypothetical protein [Shewanella phage FishSpeaker]|nr:hypothetical protein [Shewanella phage FishSpeaker]